MKIECPFCDASYSDPEIAPGARVQCAKCEKKFFAMPDSPNRTKRASDTLNFRWPWTAIILYVIATIDVISALLVLITHMSSIYTFATVVPLAVAMLLGALVVFSFASILISLARSNFYSKLILDELREISGRM